MTSRRDHDLRESDSFARIPRLAANLSRDGKLHMHEMTMPDVSPFRGVRYDVARVGTLSDVVAPLTT